MYGMSCCTTLAISSAVDIIGISSGVGVSKMLDFILKFFYVMGKGLSGELFYM